MQIKQSISYATMACKHAFKQLSDQLMSFISATRSCAQTRHAVGFSTDVDSLDHTRWHQGDPGYALACESMRLSFARCLRGLRT